MRNYLILKEKAARFNEDAEIQALLADLNAVDPSVEAYLGPYSAERAAALQVASFDRTQLGARGYAYERLDQLTIELLLGVR
jgi:xylose isomerase